MLPSSEIYGKDIISDMYVLLFHLKNERDACNKLIFDALKTTSSITKEFQKIHKQHTALLCTAVANHVDKLVLIKIM